MQLEQRIRMLENQIRDERRRRDAEHTKLTDKIEHLETDMARVKYSVVQMGNGLLKATRVDEDVYICMAPLGKISDEEFSGTWTENAIKAVRQDSTLYT